MGRPRRPYTESIDVLVALITYLGLTSFRSRTPRGLAESLGLDETEVAQALDGFPGLFRKGTMPTNREGQVSYTLHARYGTRQGDDPISAERTGDSPPLPADLLTSLLEFVATRSQHEIEAKTSRANQIYTAAGVTVAAVAAIIGAVISAVAGG